MSLRHSHTTLLIKLVTVKMESIVKTTRKRASKTYTTYGCTLTMDAAKALEFLESVVKRSSKLQVDCEGAFTKIDGIITCLGMKVPTVDFMQPTVNTYFSAQQGACG